MRSILILALVVGFFQGHNCLNDDQSKFEAACELETLSKKAYDAYEGSEKKKSILFRQYLEAMRERGQWAKFIGVADCSQVAEQNPQVEVIKGEQVIRELCNAEAQAKQWAQQSQSKLAKHKLDKMASYAKSRHELLTNRIWTECEKWVYCPELNDADISSGDDGKKRSDSELEQNFSNWCKQEAAQDYNQRKIYQVVGKYESILSMDLAKQASDKYTEARDARDDYCHGNIRECCNEQLVEEARNEATLRVAELLGRMVDSLVDRSQDYFRTHKVEDRWEERFNRLCAIEHQTANGQFYRAREQTLRSLHERAMKDRMNLGKALGRETCPPQAGAAAIPAPPAGQVNIDARCEEEWKAKLMCGAFEEAKVQLGGSVHGLRDFNEQHDKWCSLNLKILKARDSVKKVYKPPNCNDQMVALISEDARVEAEVLLELMELERSASDSAKATRKAILHGLQDQHKILVHLKKAYKKDFEKEVDPARKEQTRLALKLILDKLTDLETNEDYVKHQKFDLLHPSTWSG